MIGYSAVKDSGIEWMGTIPEHWEVKKLNLLGEAITGLTYSPNDIVNEEEGILVLRASNIQNGKITFDDNVYINMEIPEKLITRENDILICSRNGSRRLIGKAALIDKQSEGVSFGAFTTVYRSNLSKYLFYVFQSPLFEFQIATFLTSTINQLTIGNLKSLQIPIPSKEEQKAIVNYLKIKTKEIDLLLNQKQSLITLLEQQRQSIITEAVTKGLNPNVKMKDSGVEWIGEIPEHWEKKKMKYVGKAITGLTYSPEDLTDENGTIVLRSTNIKKGKITLHDNVYVDKKISNKLLTKKNDILICSRNGSRKLIGKNALIESEIGLSFGAFTTVFRSDINNFIYFVLNSNFFEAQLGTYLTSTINQLTIGNLNNMDIVLPTIEEQRDIVDYLKDITNEYNSLINKIGIQIKKLKECRQSLIYEAVTGKIDVRDMELN